MASLNFDHQSADPQTHTHTHTHTHILSFKRVGTPTIKSNQSTLTTKATFANTYLQGRN